MPSGASSRAKRALCRLKRGDVPLVPTSMKSMMVNFKEKTELHISSYKKKKRSDASKQFWHSANFLLSLKQK